MGRSVFISLPVIFCIPSPPCFLPPSVGSLSALWLCSFESECCRLSFPLNTPSSRLMSHRTAPFSFLSLPGLFTLLLSVCPSCNFLPPLLLLLLLLLFVSLSFHAAFWPFVAEVQLDLFLDTKGGGVRYDNFECPLTHTHTRTHTHTHAHWFISTACCCRSRANHLLMGFYAQL